MPITLWAVLSCSIWKKSRVADNLEYGDWYFEIVDIDGARIDKVLIAPKVTANQDK
jgi:CBS domain containing-hemolysin-like protein